MIKKKSNHTINKIFKIFLWFTGAAIILLLVAYFFIQTETFNKWALDYTLNKLNATDESKTPNENKIDAASLNGNILKGLRLNYGSITVRGDTLLKFDYLDVKYDIWGLFNEEIRLDYVILNNPRINLAKIKNRDDSLGWNFLNLFKSEKEKDTSATDFDWDVTVEKLKVENGFVRIAGDTTRLEPYWKEQRARLKEFDFNNLDISNLELELNVKYYRAYKNISLKNLSFNSNSDFNIRKFAFDANINIKDTLTHLWALEIITDRSSIKIDKIIFDKFNPFVNIAYEDFGGKNIEADINIEKFDFDDLKFFVPSVDMLDSTAGLVLKAKGKYGDLNIDNLEVKLSETHIPFKGNVKNLHKPSELYFDVVSKNLRINSSEVRKVYKDIPDYSQLGIIEGNVLYRGTIDNFYTEYALNTDAGYTDGKVTLYLKNESYNGYITTSRFNLGKVLKNNSLNSNLNMAADFSGKGFNLNSLNANIDYSINSSSLAGYDIKSSFGKIKAIRSNINLNIQHRSSGGNIDVAGNVNIANTDNPKYSLKGKVNSLDVSRFTRSKDDKSNLNFSFNVNGSGSNLNNINGKYNLNLSNSTYASYQIPQTPVNVELNSSRSNGKIKVSTDMLDFNADGSMDIASIIKAVAYNISSFTEKMNDKMGVETARHTSAPVRNNFNFNYRLETNDTTKLQQVLKPFGMRFNGTVNGSASNSSNGFTSITSLDINNFVYRDTVIVIQNLSSDIDFRNNYTELNSLLSYSIDMNTIADRVVFNNNGADSLKLNLNLQNSVADIKLNVKQDTSIKGTLSGNVDFSSPQIIASMDSVFFKYNQYRISNENTWVVNYMPNEEINFQKFGFRSGNTILNLRGNYSFTRNSDLVLEGNDLNLSDIYKTVNDIDTSSHRVSPVQGTIKRLYVAFKGTTEQPEINMELNSGILTYQDTAIGRLNAFVEYKNEIGNLEFVLTNENKGILKLSGNVPYKFSSVGLESTQFGIENIPAEVRLIAKDFQIRYFSKLLLPDFDLQGVINGEISSHGTILNPDLTGNVKINNGGIYFSTTGMYHNFDVLLKAADSKLNVEKFQVYSENYKSQKINITGNVDFTGMKINDIDLTASGNLVLLDDDVVDNDIGVYGYIFGGTGKPSIAIKGNLDTLNITGQFLIKDADISSVPMEGYGYDAYSDNFVYNVSSDSIQLKTDTLIVIGPDDFKKLNPFERYKYIIATDIKSAGILNLDLNVKTQKHAVVDLDIASVLKGKLFGELSADLDIKTNNGEYNAFGTVNVIDNSYFRLYRKFKISDSYIMFNGPIAEPQLNIKANYQSQKNTVGTESTHDIRILITVTGSPDNPDIVLKLFEDGNEIKSEDAQADAITYLVFGKSRNELSESERTSIASTLGSTIGSAYITSYLTESLSDVLPFIVDTEFKYTEGDIKNSDISVISEFGDVTVKVGGKMLQNVGGLQFTILYPLNNLFGFALPEKLMLEISKEPSSTLLGGTSLGLTTDFKVIYKIKF